MMSPEPAKRKRPYVPTCACGFRLSEDRTCPGGCKQPELRAPHLRRRKVERRESERARIATRESELIISSRRGQ